MRRSTSVASTASAEAALPVQPTDSPAPTSSLWHVQVVARHDQRYQMAVGQKRQPLFIQVRGRAAAAFNKVKGGCRFHSFFFAKTSSMSELMSDKKRPLGTCC
jgi:hypothetical protein